MSGHEESQSQSVKDDKPSMLQEATSYGDGPALTVSVPGSHGNISTNHQVMDSVIEEIGFGRFQMELTLTCDFGFLADQVCCLLPGLTSIRD